MSICIEENTTSTYHPVDYFFQSIVVVRLPSSASGGARRAFKDT